MEMHHIGWRSPDGMRAPPRQQPHMSPYEHHHRPPYAQSSREDMRTMPPAEEAGGGGNVRARPRTASQRPHEQAMWPNPWLRRHWDPDAPLDLNKPLDASKGEMEGDELTTDRAFQPSFAMDLNDLVHSLWTPPKRSPLSPRSVGHSSPAYPSLPMQRHVPQHDETPTPEEYEWGARRGNPRPTYEMASRSKRVTPPPMREPMRDMKASLWSEHAEESHFPRYMEAPPRSEYTDPRPQRQQYDPPMGRRPYADREYYEPSHPRRVVPSSHYESYESYAPRHEDDGYHSADEFAWHTPGKNPRTTPSSGMTNPQRMETRMMNPPYPPSVSADPYVYGGMSPRVAPRYYVHDMESMRHQSDMERRLMADRGLHGVDARTDHADPTRDPRTEPRTGTGTGTALPLRRARSDPRAGHQDMPQMAPPDNADYHQYQYHFQRDARPVRASPSPQRSSPFLSPHSNASSPSIHSAPFRESPSYVSRMAPSSDTGDEVEF